MPITTTEIVDRLNAVLAEQWPCSLSQAQEIVEDTAEAVRLQTLVDCAGLLAREHPGASAVLLDMTEVGMAARRAYWAERMRGKISEPTP